MLNDDRLLDDRRLAEDDRFPATARFVDDDMTRCERSRSCFCRRSTKCTWSHSDFTSRTLSSLHGSSS